MITRRKFLGGLVACLAAPAIVKAENIMRIAQPKLVVVDSLTEWQRQIEKMQRHALMYGMGVGSIMYKNTSNPPVVWTGRELLTIDTKSPVDWDFKELIKVGYTSDAEGFCFSNKG